MTDLKLELTEGQIQNAIAVALAEALAPERRDAMIRDVIRAHLHYKEKSYDKETFLSKAVGQQIKGMLQTALQERLKELEPDVKRIVDSSLGGGFAASVYAQLEAALRHRLVSNITIQVELDEEI